MIGPRATSRLATILATLFGLQVLRAFFPLLLYVLKDRYGLSSIALGEVGIAVFATGFVVPRLVNRRHAFVALLAARGALQLWTGDPAVSLALAASAVVAFLAFLAAPGPDRAVGFLVGALLDVSLHAAFGTRDLHWGGSTANFVAGALVGVGIVVLLRDRSAIEEPGPALGLLAWGPILFLQLELLGNVARLSARTALPTCLSGVMIAAGFAVAATLGLPLARARGLPRFALPLLAGACSVAAVLNAETTGGLAAPLLWIAQLAAAVLLIRALDVREGHPSHGIRAASMGMGSLLLIVLLFLRYARYDLPIPLSPFAGKLVAVAVLFVAALSRRAADDISGSPMRGWAAAACMALALLPLVRGVPKSPPPPMRGDGTAVVVSFNLHAGFDERGGWAFDRMIRSLREQGPDVAALQEVSRGWVINGCADLYELSREKLGLTATYGPTVTTDWGSAVFVRGTIARAATSPLPPPDLNLSRALTVVERGEADVFPRRILATHLHHRTEDDVIRDLQARAIADSYPVSADAVLLGDFNAQPRSRCFSILRDAGWSDAAGTPEEASAAATFPAARPVRRIDTIFVGDASRVVSCEVAPGWGSDHRAVIVRLRTASP